MSFDDWRFQWRVRAVADSSIAPSHRNRAEKTCRASEAQGAKEVPRLRRRQAIEAKISSIVERFHIAVKTWPHLRLQAVAQPPYIGAERKRRPGHWYMCSLRLRISRRVPPTRRKNWHKGILTTLETHTTMGGMSVGVGDMRPACPSMSRDITPSAGRVMPFGLSRIKLSAWDSPRSPLRCHSPKG